MRIGVVLVHYRTPDLANDAVGALRRSRGLDSAEVDLVVVDNGSDDAGRAVLQALPARLVTARGNLGYAGGVNLGFAELCAGELKGEGPDVLVAMNPDVLVGPSCLAELIRALGDGVGVAGPRFVWGEGLGIGKGDEDEHVVLMPPADAVGRRRELARYLAESKGGHWARRARTAWRRHAQRHWTAAADLESYSLSGAMLAISADAWSQVGPFDEGYRLYFEETDWLRRAKKKGVPARHVPTAVAHHGYARSTPKEPQAAAWFADSERRFRRRWYGGAFGAFLERLARKNPPRPAEVDDGAEGEPTLGPGVRWIEIGASPLGPPAGGIHLPEGCAAGTELWDLVPDVVSNRSREMTFYWRTVDADSVESRSAEVGTAGNLPAPGPAAR